MNDYPAMIATVGHVEPVPRRIRAYLAGEKVLDTTRALYVWEWPHYPQDYIPLGDVRRDLLIPQGWQAGPSPAPGMRLCADVGQGDRQVLMQGKWLQRAWEILWS